MGDVVRQGLRVGDEVRHAVYLGVVVDRQARNVGLLVQGSWTVTYGACLGSERVALRKMAGVQSTKSSK